MQFKLFGNMKFTIAAMFIVLFISVTTLVLLNKKPICIDSNIIGRIERITLDGSFQAYQCNKYKSVEFDEKLIQSIPEITRRIYDLEKFFGDTSPLTKSIELNWLDQTKDVLRVQDNKIFISDDLLQKSNVLESNIIRIWLRERAPGINLDRTLLESGLVDLILFSLGKKNIEFGSDFKWPTNLKTAMSACQSKEISADLFPLCLDFDFNSDSIFLGSARPLISNSFIRAYSKMNLKEGHELVRQLPEFIRALSAIPSSSPLNSEETILDSVSKVESEFIKLTHFLSLSADVLKRTANNNLWTQFVENFKIELRKQGWNPEVASSKTKGALQLEHLMIFEQDSKWSQELLARIRQNQNSYELNAVISNGKIWFPSSENWLPLTAISEMSIYQIMHVSCQTPSSITITQLLARAEKVLFVKNCDSKMNIVVRGYLKNGYQGFAIENPTLSFFQIHSPSFYQARKFNTNIPFENLQTNNWSHPFFTALGWGKPEWHTTGKYYESKSVIQALQAYRL